MLLAEAKIQLAETGSPETEALMLLGHASGQSRAALLARPDSTVDPPAVRRFKAMVVHRQSGCAGCLPDRSAGILVTAVVCQ